MNVPHYFCESCQLSIPIKLKEVHENTQYHKKGLDKFLKQGMIKFDIHQLGRSR